MSSELSIYGSAIRTNEAGLYSITDCWKASGALAKNKPAKWLANDKTQETVDILKVGNPHSSECGNPHSLYRVIRGNVANQGTWDCRELVYDYAMWVSSAFKLMVIRAFDDLANNRFALASARINELEALTGLSLTLSSKQVSIELGMKQTLFSALMLQTGLWSEHKDRYIVSRHSEWFTTNKHGTILTYKGAVDQIRAYLMDNGAGRLVQRRDDYQVLY